MKRNASFRNQIRCDKEALFQMEKWKRFYCEICPNFEHYFLANRLVDDSLWVVLYCFYTQIRHFVNERLVFGKFRNGKGFGRKGMPFSVLPWENR